MDMDFKWTTRAEKLLVVAYWWEQQQGRCCICNYSMEPYHRDASRNPNAASVEHLIPKRDNGPDTVGNVRLAHRSCNNRAGGLWSENEHRKSVGLSPLVEPSNGEKHAFMSPHEVAKRKARGVAWCALNAVSLPRGATLLPQYSGLHKTLGSKAARKMSPEETARWLRDQGIKGA